MTVGDFNGDGKLDVAVADFHTQQVSVLLGNGDGTFQSVKAYSTGANPSSVVMADFNGDGKIDLALTSTPLASSAGNLVSLLLGNGDGTFGAPTLFGTGSQAYSATVGDFNGDGAPDLAVANGVSNTVSVLLNSQGTKISLVPSSNPSVYGQSVTFSASVAASIPEAGSPSGTVSIRNGNTVLGSGPLVGGAFSASTSALTTGSDSISAVYSGDGNFQKHTVTVAQTVQQASSTTLLVSSLNPSAEGQSVTFTATVGSGTSGTPTGSVKFLDGATTLGNSTINSSGSATVSLSNLSIGTHVITAAYAGDTNFTDSTSPALNQIVQTGATSVSLSSSPNPSNFDQAVTLTAAIKSSTTGTPTGTVTFMQGTTKLGTSSLNASGAASLALSNLTVGTDAITAAYSGDNTFSGATSAVMNQIVQKAGTTTELVSNSAAGNLTLTATVTATAGAPSGAINFMDGSNQIGTANLNANGVATFSTSSLTAGAHTITAAYSGDGDFNTSTSSAVSITADFNLSASAMAPSPVSDGQSATSTITITSTNGFNASSVTFACSIAPTATPAPTCSIGSITVANGTATATLTASAAASRAAVASLGPKGGMGLFAFGIMMPGLLFTTLSVRKKQRRHLASYAVVTLILGFSLLQAACGGGGSAGSSGGPGGTPSGNYTITVTGSANNTQHMTTAILSVK